MSLTISSNLANLSECDVRFVEEAECSSCVAIVGSATPGLKSVQAAVRHSGETGNVVILTEQ